MCCSLRLVFFGFFLWFSCGGMLWSPSDGFASKPSPPPKYHHALHSASGDLDHIKGEQDHMLAADCPLKSVWMSLSLLSVKTMFSFQNFQQVVWQFCGSNRRCCI